MAIVSAILQAAGMSTRMGTPKPLLEWHGIPLVEYQIFSLIDAGVDDVLVVLGHNADEVSPAVDLTPARWVLNPDYAQGKTTSIKSGLMSIHPNAEAILLLAVDQPRTSAIVSQVLNAHVANGALITSPRYQGHGGHPLIFDGSLKPELEHITEEMQGLREVFAAHRKEVLELEIDDPMVRLDLNTPEAYEEAKRLYKA
ncbi:MAG: nucleotidyltransferase family protein [Chloroflexi bacterium]|nr:nucleotidyltransferase family protein [Chloroflexota bacterium]MDA1227449.1 nucleotidyltransferase family protein [Chloroflexota bacterium]